MLKRSFIVFSTMLATSSAAFAAENTASTSDFFFKPYVGAEYQFTRFGNTTDSDTGLATSDWISRDLNGGNVHVGARIHKNLGIEFGYQQTETTKKNDILGSGLNAKTKFSSETFDVLGYLPVAEKVELIGTAGISNSHAKASYSGALDKVAKDSEIEPRIGAGAQYSLTDNLNLRGLVRYQAADFGDSVENAVVGSLGVNYSF